MKVLKGKTSSGFEFEIEETALNDWELLEALVEIDDGHIGSTVHAVNMLLGKDQAQALKEHCRDKRSGRVSQKAMFKEFSEILSSHGVDDEKSKKS